MRLEFTDFLLNDGWAEDSIDGEYSYEYTGSNELISAFLENAEDFTGVDTLVEGNPDTGEILVSENLDAPIHPVCRLRRLRALLRREVREIELIDESTS